MRVTSINGHTLKQPVDLSYYRVRPVVGEGRSGSADKDAWDWKAKWGGTVHSPEFKSGEQWEFTGAETCSMKVPLHLWDDTANAAATPPDFGANGFLDTFEFFKARRLK